MYLNSNRIQRDRHQEVLMAAATRLGIGFEDLLPKWNQDAVRYFLGDRSCIVLEGRVYPGLSVIADTICNDKQVCKAYFSQVGVPIPESIVFSAEAGVLAEADEEALGRFMAAGQSYVCKPLDGTEGHGVGMNLTHLAAALQHVARYGNQYTVWMLEQQVAGEDLRIQVIGGVAVAACRRVPAQVTGDGVQTLEALIAQHNARIAQQNPTNHLAIDEATLGLMTQQQVGLSDVIEAGRRVQLKLVSNMGQGGLAIDVTDQLHPQYGTWASALSAAIGIETFAFDLMCTDASAHPVGHAWALELNPRSQWLHHTFSEVRQHDIPAMVLGWLFPR